MSNMSRPDWVGQRAVAWVLDDAPVPAELAITLIAIARRCDENGRGSCQSEPTLAEKTGKSKEQVHRDILKLLAARLILPGDSTLPERLGIPAGKRPAVYDVNLALKGPKPSKASKNKSGKRKDLVVTPGMEATSSMHATPGMEAQSTPSIHATPTPGMDATQTKPLNNPLNNPSSCGTAAAGLRAASPEEEGEEISDDQRTDNHTTAAGIADRHRPAITAIEARRLAYPIADALANGWTVDNIIAELDADPTGLGNLTAGLIGRARTMATSQPPAAPPVKISYSGHTVAVANQPSCRHGYPGGDIPIPDTLWSPCATCRRQAGWTPDHEGATR
jgi:hypothetical protein